MRVKLYCFNSWGPSNSTAREVPVLDACIRQGIPSFSIVWLTIFVATILSTSAPARGYQFESHEPCDLLLEQATRDRWALLEYRLGPGGQPQASVEVPHSSDARFAHQLLACVDRGKAQLPGQAGGAYKVLRFAPARGQEIVASGRQLELEVPRELQRSFLAPSFEGYIALRVEMNEFGMIRSKDLLFSSNAALGEALLGSLDESLKVVSPGNKTGPYTDVLYMRFESGILINFSQSHFVDQVRLACLQSSAP